MKIRFSPILSITFSILLLSLSTFAQQNKSALTLGFGSSYYFGDLSPYEDMGVGFVATPSFNFHLGYIQHLDEHSEILYDLTIARIQGDDFTYSRRNINAYKDQFLRNLHFRNDIKELSARWRYHFKPTNMYENFDRPKFNGYATIGLGILGHNPEAKLLSGQGGTNWVYLRDKNTSGQHLLKDKYSLVQMVIPFGIGMRYRVNKSLDLNVESVLRISTTDYLDDVGNTQYLPENLFNSSEAYALHDRSAESSALFKNQNRTSYLQKLYGSNISEGIAKDLGPDRGFNRLFARNDGYCLVQLSLIYWLKSN